ncbi:MAG: metal ABC transporter substrate-binding protein [Christensenellales bacterium]
MLKKLLLPLLMISALLMGCTTQVEPDGLTIIATSFPSYDFARSVAGDRANIRMLLSPGAEAHSYEPTPQDIMDIQNCDLFIYSGGENEAWVTDMAASLELDDNKVIAMLNTVTPLTEETVEGMQEERHHLHHDESCRNSHDTGYDEHVWTSPKNAALIAKAICDKLCGIDPANASIYSANTAEYERQLFRLDEEFRALVENAPRRTVVFADRFPVRYFTEEYGLEYYAAFPGCSADTEPSAATIAFLIDKVKEKNIPVVFSIELSNGRLASAVSESTGAKVLTFTSCHNLTREEFEGGATYISLMESNLLNLREALY